MWLWHALAGRLVWESLKQVSLGLRTIALGPAEERRVQALRETALRKALEELLPRVDPDDQTYLAEIFGGFFPRAGPARRVLEAVLERRCVPAGDLRAEISQSVELDQIERTWPIRFDEFAVEYGERLRDGLFDDACRADSPLFHLLCLYQLENITRGISGSTGESQKPRDVLVREFMDMYLGSRDHPKPFGGRDADFKRLDEWLHDSARPSYAILAAEAGRGKSALLVHWVVRLGFLQEATGHGLRIVYFPISQRKETNAEEVALSSLAGRLANLYEQPPPQTDSLSDLRATFLSYLRERPTAEAPLLVVLDGLDEAAGWEVSGSLFPEIPPPGLRVLVAARSKTGDPGEPGWRRKLEWDRDARKCELMQLSGLNREGIRDVLEKIGNPLDRLAREIDVVAKLHELTEGDPLLVGLWVEYLQEKTAGPGPFNVASLKGIPPRLQGFFDAWFHDQERLWKRQGRLGFKQRTVRGLARLCAFAKGPLKRADVLALAPDIFTESWDADEAAGDLSRFIVGDGSSNGYVFSHPRLGQYFAEELEPAEREAWNLRFLEYCWGTFEKLRSGQLQPPQAPAYAVRWFSSHLPRGDGRLYVLVCEEWLRAWEFVDGTPAGFLADAERARLAAQGEGPRAAAKLLRPELCLASVAARAANVEPDALGRLVGLGIVNPVLAAVVARRMADPAQRALALLRLAGSPERPDHGALLGEAWEAAQKVTNVRHRAILMAKVASKLPDEDREAAWQQAWEAVQRVSDQGERARALAGVAGEVPEGQRPLLNEIWEAVRKVSDQGERACLMADVAGKLPEGERDAAWRQAWEVARNVTEELAWLLAVLASKLPEGEREAAWRQAWEAAQKVTGGEERLRLMAEVVESLPEGEPELAKEIWIVVQDVPDEYPRARLMAAVAEMLPEGEGAAAVQEAWEAARQATDEFDAALLMARLVAKLPEGQRESAWQEAWEAAQKVSRERSRWRLMAMLARELPKGEQGAAWQQTWDSMQRISDELPRARLMVAVAEKLPEEEREAAWRRAWDTANRICDDWHRAWVVAEVADNLPETERTAAWRQAWETAQRLSDKQTRAWLMEHVAGKLPEGERELVKEVWNTALNISDQRDRARLMAEVANKVQDEELGLAQEVWDAAQELSDGRDRAWLMALIAGKLRPEERDAAWQQAWEAVQIVSDNEARAWSITKLAGKLPEGQREAAWQHAWEATQRVSDDLGRAKLTAVVAAYLPEERREVACWQAWEAAQKVSDERDRARLMAEVASKLPEAEREAAWQHAWEATQQVSDQWYRARLIAEFAGSVPEVCLPNLLWEVRILPARVEVGDALEPLGQRWSAVCRAAGCDQYAEFVDIVRDSSRLGRPALLQAIRGLLPVIEAFGGTEALQETVQAVQDVSRWWP